MIHRHLFGRMHVNFDRKMPDVYQDKLYSELHFQIVKN